MEKVSVLKEANAKITQKRSQFFGILCHLPSEELFRQLLDAVRAKHSSCTHIAYAYIVGNSIRACDDKEPSGTAGLQILSELQKHNLTDVALFVVRYFGGTRLGKSGLADAYKECAIQTIEQATFAKKQIVLAAQFICSPQNLGKFIAKISNLGGKYEIDNKKIVASFVGIEKGVLLQQISTLADVKQIVEEEKWQQ